MTVEDTEWYVNMLDDTSIWDCMFDAIPDDPLD